MKVISLADLVAAELTSGLKGLVQLKHIAHVIDLIQRVPLDVDVAAKLPKHLRASFKELVEQVDGTRRRSMTPMRFLQKYRVA